MDLRKGWMVLKARLRGWYSKMFGGDAPDNVTVAEEPETVETTSSETSAQETPPDTTEDVPAEEATEAVAQDTAPASDGLVSEIREKLEHLHHNRQIVVRKKSDRMEWQVAGADFTDAYLFLLALPGADIRNLRHHTVADGITYHLELPDDVTAELTDGTRQEDTIAVLRLMDEGRCMLKINFINNQN